MSNKKRTGSFTVITDDDNEVEVIVYEDGDVETLITDDNYEVKDLGDDAYDILYPIPKKARKVGNNQDGS